MATKSYAKGNRETLSDPHFNNDLDKEDLSNKLFLRAVAKKNL
jgi:hypothetical protein